MINMSSINVDNRSFSFYKIEEMIQSGEMVLSGDTNVDEETKSELIDKIMCHIPIPRVYAFIKDNKLVVINPKALAAAYSYMSNEFTLKSKLTNFPNVRYSHLQPMFKRRMKEQFVDFIVLGVYSENKDEYINDFISMYKNLY